MKPSRAPKQIHEFLIEKGFGYDKRYRYYHALLHDSLLTTSLSIYNHKEGVEIGFGIYYPNEQGISGSMINPEEVSSLLPNGKLFMTDIYEHKEDNYWDIGNLDNMLNKLNTMLPYWLKVTLNSVVMLKLMDYLLGVKDNPPIEFDFLLNKIDLRRNQSPSKYWHKSLFAILNRDYGLAKKCLNAMPDWCLEDEEEQKVLSDCKKKKITVSDDLIKYMQEIGAKEIDLDNW